MVQFTRPATQDRFNATIYELLRMKFNGEVTVPGNWDPYITLDYLENRFRLCIIPTLTPNGSSFEMFEKLVIFSQDGVLVIPDWN